MTQSTHPFSYCGYVSLDDLHTSIWKECFKELEAFQKRFLEHESKFRSANYIWPSDALHKWSRLWEYPYTLYQMKHWQEISGIASPTVVDLGSGVTFFPLYLAAQGYKIEAVDIDPVGGLDFPRACDALGIPRSQVDFHQADARSLPFDDNSVDCLFSVSVLEHIPGSDEVVGEAARVLRDDGLLVLTIDIGLDGIYEIKPDSFQALKCALERSFVQIFPERSIHPLRQLTTQNSPYPYVFPRTSPPAAFVRTVKRAIKRLPLRYPRRLACYGYVGTPKR